VKINAISRGKIPYDKQFFLHCCIVALFRGKERTMGYLADREGLIKPLFWLVVSTLALVIVMTQFWGGFWGWILFIAIFLLSVNCGWAVAQCIRVRRRTRKR
jgi:hypothetical protein